MRYITYLEKLKMGRVNFISEKCLNMYKIDLIITFSTYTIYKDVDVHLLS
jgi:hypothetical protein